MNKVDAGHILEKEMATHTNVLAWRIPGMGNPGGLPSIESHRVGHDWRDLAAAAAVHIHKGILFSHKKEGDSEICSNMDGSGDYHTKWRNPGRHIWCHLCVESKKSDTSRFIYKTNRLPDIENELLVTKGERVGEGLIRSMGLTDTH